MRSIRSWFTGTEERASGAQDYTGLLLARSLAEARGDGGNIRSQAAYKGALTVIENSVGVATLTGQTPGPCKDISQPSRDRWLTPANPTG